MVRKWIPLASVRANDYHGGDGPLPFGSRTSRVRAAESSSDGPDA